MGASKSDYFSQRKNDMANLIKAMAHPARIAIIELLVKEQNCICNDLVNELPLSQPTVSQHLKELKTAGLIKGTIEGNSICYCIEPKAIHKLQEYFSQISIKLEKQKNNC